MARVRVRQFLLVLLIVAGLAASPARAAVFSGSISDTGVQWLGRFCFSPDAGTGTGTCAVHLAKWRLFLTVFTYICTCMCVARFVLMWWWC